MNIATKDSSARAGLSETQGCKGSLQQKGLTDKESAL